MSAIKLSDLQQGADEKYPDFEIEIEDGKVVFNPTLEEIKAHHEFAMSELRPSDKNISSGFPAVEVSV
jgi:hypothetical protein